MSPIRSPFANGLIGVGGGRVSRGGRTSRNKETNDEDEDDGSGSGNAIGFGSSDDDDEMGMDRRVRRLSLRGQRKARRASVLYSAISSIFRSSTSTVAMHRRLMSDKSDVPTGIMGDPSTIVTIDGKYFY